MTQVLAVDYSFTHPSPALLAQKGFKAAGRYLGGTRDKQITRTEAADLHAHGLGIWLVFEGFANRSAQGRAAGIADAKTALAQARLVGLPAGCPIFFAVDFDAAWAQVEPYFKGVQSILGARAGAYGSDKITQAARTIGIRYTWQTCAWSGGRLDAHANIYQRQAMTRFVPGCDENVILNAFPMWGTAVAPKPPAPVVRPVSSTVVPRPNFITMHDSAVRMSGAAGAAMKANTKGSPAYKAAQVVAAQAAAALRTVAPFVK